MYATAIELDYTDSRTIHSINNRAEMHRDIQTLFNDSRENEKNVYRIVKKDDKVILYIYSNSKIIKSNMHFGMKFLGEGELPALKNGDVVKFDILVAPTKSNSQGKKIPINNTAMKTEWLLKQAERNGFEILDVFNFGTDSVYVKKKEHEWKLTTARYKIVAKITNEDDFNKAMVNGIGKGGSYGLGMMLLTAM